MHFISEIIDDSESVHDSYKLKTLVETQEQLICQVKKKKSRIYPILDSI